MVKLDFDSLITEAESRPFVGWDFSWLRRAGRMFTQPLPWDYGRLVIKLAQGSIDLLDLDTGGGEWLARFSNRPRLTVATESYPSNVKVAARKLHNLGVDVLRIEGAPDNNVQTLPETRGQLPFRSGSFHLVVNRHSSFVAHEVSRVLALNGAFITEQVGDPANADFHRLLKLAPPALPSKPWNLSVAAGQLENAGFRVLSSGEGEEVLSFVDVGAFAWYLKAIPWIIPGFSIRTFREPLKDLHLRIESEGPVQARHPAFWLEAVKS